MVGPVGAIEVTPGALKVVVTRAEPVPRLFALTLPPPKALSIVTISGRDYQRDENLNFSWVFDSAHQSSNAGSVELSATPIRCGKGAQHG